MYVVNVAKHPKSMPTRSRAIPCNRTNSTQSCTILSFSFLSHTCRTGGRPQVRAERGQRVQHDVSLRDNPSYV